MIPVVSVVYFVRIGKHIKIGVTTNLHQRLKTFSTSSPDVELLLAVRGERDLERRLHDYLNESRVTREMFRYEKRILDFIWHVERSGLQPALDYLVATDPKAIARRKAEEKTIRVKQARQSRAEKDAYFASLVAQRKERLGW